MTPSELARSYDEMTLELQIQRGCVCRHLEYDRQPKKHLVIIAQKI
ncbi:MAG: hypothetical protein WAW39_13815 [Prosthecobacter sp.]